MIIRRLTSQDASSAVPLMAELGYPTNADAFAERFAALSTNPHSVVLVAEAQGSIVGLVAVHSFEMLHRPGRLGRITALVVASSARGRGVGTDLLKAAEDHLRQSGCTMLEVTSNDRRENAHAFYAARGYREKRVRFVKSPAT
jgi:ribosomal protein S18 acetylase RimI-like enzyme